MPPLYDPEAVRPMWEELVQGGITTLRTAAEVGDVLAKPGTTLIIVNSTCGCAAGDKAGRNPSTARRSLPGSPDHRVCRGRQGGNPAARERMPEIAPSSLSVGLFKDGALIYSLERRDIERMTPDDVAGELGKAFMQRCSRKGLSVPAEVYSQVVHARQCGSQIPRFVG